MNRYTIHCTEEQTKKALELGAPITNIHTVGNDGITKEWKLVNPTAEQMMGFFRSKNIHIVIQKDIVDNWSAYGHEISPIEFTVFDRLTSYNSFEEATLAAVDAALEHLIDNN